MLYSKDIGQVNRLYIQVREHPAAVRLVLLVRPRQVSCIMLLWIRAGGQKLLESDQELMCFLEFISFLLCHYIWCICSSVYAFFYINCRYEKYMTHPERLYNCREYWVFSYKGSLTWGHTNNFAEDVKSVLNDKILQRTKAFNPPQLFELWPQGYRAIERPLTLHSSLSSDLKAIERPLTLQLIQNAAARTLTRTKKYEHISPVLASLHWLPVKSRIDFKVLLLTYKALNDLAPNYLKELVVPYCPLRPLRSQSAGLLVVPRISKTTVGGRAFSYRAPFLWNNLPASIRDADTLPKFKSRLKTFLFSTSYSHK